MKAWQQSCCRPKAKQCISPQACHLTLCLAGNVSKEEGEMTAAGKPVIMRPNTSAAPTTASTRSRPGGPPPNVSLPAAAVTACVRALSVLVNVWTSMHHDFPLVGLAVVAAVAICK